MWRDAKIELNAKLYKILLLIYVINIKNLSLLIVFFLGILLYQIF